MHTRLNLKHRINYKKECLLLFVGSVKFWKVKIIVFDVWFRKIRFFFFFRDNLFKLGSKLILTDLEFLFLWLSCPAVISTLVGDSWIVVLRVILFGYGLELAQGQGWIFRIVATEFLQIAQI
jgi:hypothetical protein